MPHYSKAHEYTKNINRKREHEVQSILKTHILDSRERSRQSSATRPSTANDKYKYTSHNANKNNDILYSRLDSKRSSVERYSTTGGIKPDLLTSSNTNHQNRLSMDKKRDWRLDKIDSTKDYLRKTLEDKM